MAVKDGSGPRPAHSTKRCFLNCLEASFKPSICLPSCIASFQKLAVFFFCPPPSFEAHSKLARRQASKRPVAKARKERLRHSQTAWHWGTERARATACAAWRCFLNGHLLLVISPLRRSPCCKWGRRISANLFTHLSRQNCKKHNVTYQYQASWQFRVSASCLLI